jgi:hypothetical protein
VSLLVLLVATSRSIQHTATSETSGENNHKHQHQRQQNINLISMSPLLFISDGVAILGSPTKHDKAARHINDVRNEVAAYQQKDMVIPVHQHQQTEQTIMVSNYKTHNKTSLSSWPSNYSNACPLLFSRKGN